MRLVATADLHGQLPPKLPVGDILVVAGDICPSFTSLRREVNKDGISMVALEQALWLEQEFKPWLDGQDFKHIIAIAGNGDFVFEHSQLVPDLTWHYLQDSGVVIEGIKFWGDPWVPVKWFEEPEKSDQRPHWAFVIDDAQTLKAHSQLIPADVDVLISHGPPMGHGDLAKGQFNVGNVFLEQRLDEIKPKIVICGHIHESYGTFHHASGVAVYNVSWLQKDIYSGIVNEIKVIDL